MHSQAKPIGLFDSGIGGLTVLRELLRELPNENYLYLGDTARTPYGSKSQETILRYSKECADFLFAQGVKAIVVACNTSSCVALDYLSKHFECKVVGTIGPALDAARATTVSGRIGVVGTEATIASAAYENGLKKQNSSIEVFSKACPLFVPLVEQGMIEGEIAQKIVEYYLQDLKTAQIDTLILGCTHYPLLVNEIDNYFERKVKIIECSKAIAKEIKHWVTTASHEGQGVAKVKYFATDDGERFSKLASLFLGMNGIRAEIVEL